jgi:hypothetical protein
MFGHVPRNLIQCFRVVAEKPDGSLAIFRGCVGGLLLGKHRRQGEASIEHQRIDAQARAERFRGIGIPHGGFSPDSPSNKSADCQFMRRTSPPAMT